MNTIDDLRTTLAVHADAPGTLDPVSRGQQVAGRVRTRRRNRVAGGIAVAAVLTVGAATAVPALLNGTGQDDSLVAARTALGDVAPASRDALGITYAFDKTFTSTTDEVKLTPTFTDGQGPLLSWTTEDPDATVTVTDESGSVLWDSTQSEFEDHFVLNGWAGDQITLTSSTPGLAVATYSVDPDVEPAGVSAHGATFREQVNGTPLEAAQIRKGVREFSFPIDATGPEITISTLCSGLPEDSGVGVSVSLEDEPLTWSGDCADTLGPGSSNSSFTFTPQPEHLDGTLTVRLTTGMESQELADVNAEDVVLGAAVYQGQRSEVVGYQVVPRTVEWGGHLWEMAQNSQGRDDAAASITLTEPGPQLVNALRSGNSPERFTDSFGLEIDGKAISPTVNLAEGSEESGASTGPLLLPRGTSEVSLSGSTTPGDSAHLVLYQLAD